MKHIFKADWKTTQRGQISPIIIILTKTQLKRILFLLNSKQCASEMLPLAFVPMCSSVLFWKGVVPFGLPNSTWQLNGMACTLSDVSKWEDGCLLRSLSLFRIHCSAYSRLSWCVWQWQVATMVECLLWLRYWHIGHACPQWELDSAKVVLRHLWLLWAGIQESVKN